MKILFSTALGPYREQYFSTSPTDVFNRRFSRGDGIFGTQEHLHMQGPHVIAQNIRSIHGQSPVNAGLIEVQSALIGFMESAARLGDITRRVMSFRIGSSQSIAPEDVAGV